MSDQRAMIKAYVKEILGEFVGEEPTVDDDGDFVLTYQTAELVVCCCRANKPLRVSISSAILRGVEPSADLFEAINAINCRLPIGTTYWAAGAVRLDHHLHGPSLDQAALVDVLRAMGPAAHHEAVRLRERFGGSLAQEPSDDDDESDRVELRWVNDSQEYAEGRLVLDEEELAKVLFVLRELNIVAPEWDTRSTLLRIPEFAPDGEALAGEDRARRSAGVPVSPAADDFAVRHLGHARWAQVQAFLQGAGDHGGFVSQSVSEVSS